MQNGMFFNHIPENRNQRFNLRFSAKVTNVRPPLTSFLALWWVLPSPLKGRFSQETSAEMQFSVVSQNLLKLLTPMGQDRDAFEPTFLD